ncbi:MBOAT family O-acyltransferase [Paraflavisolibacter sp. H34]|uniref:MBOAT family O-acyltransferase n=1 Tax=Huijunlia imazamoxiresistens TaxID=3127457 RepID=UPI003018871F
MGAGLFKKIILSDYINVNFVQYIFDDPSRHTGLECLLGVYGYALVIYCDFSGYSEMAIGMARWFGFRIPENFRMPYQSATITEFWRRWHISLSSWLRDYLYIPLGGNRKGKVRTYVHLFITMVLGGFWHGASWNFLIWGALHGGMLAVEKLVGGPQKVQAAGRVGKWLGVLFTFHFVCFCWIFFRAATLEDALVVIRQVFSNFGASGIGELWAHYGNVFGMMALGFLFQFVPWQMAEGLRLRSAAWHPVVHVLLFLLFMFLCVQVKTAEQVLPVYLQF